MKVLVFDGPEMNAGKERFGAKFHVYYQDLEQPTDQAGVFHEVDAPLGHEVPFEQVRLAETYVERGFATVREDAEEAPAAEPEAKK